jgi:hypothetical protein
MLKNICSVAIILLTVFALTVCGGPGLLYAAETKTIHEAATFEKGKLYQYGKIKVLELNGTYREMGRQYGKLLSAEIHGMYAEIVKQFTLNKIAVSERQIEEFSKKLFGLYPKRFQDIALGMSETSGMEMEKLAALNEAFDFLLSSQPSAAALGEHRNHCSAMAAWGNYTGGGPLVMGRNFDFPAFYRKFNPYIVVIVFNPSDGCRSAAVITHAGQIGAIQAFNDAGLVLENNNVSNSGDARRYFGDRTPFLIKDLEMVFDYSTIEGLDAAFKGSRFHFPLIFNVASPDQAYCYETTTLDVKRRNADQEGLLIGVNHFLHPEWILPQQGDNKFIQDSFIRHKNLAALAARYKGSIDAVRMMAILDIPQDKGGATPPDKSIYQFVTVPASLKLWIKVREYAEWTEIDLKKLFHSGR